MAQDHKILISESELRNIIADEVHKIRKKNMHPTYVVDYIITALKKYRYP